MHSIGRNVSVLGSKVVIERMKLSQRATGCVREILEVMKFTYRPESILQSCFSDFIFHQKVSF